MDIEPTPTQPDVGPDEPALTHVLAEISDAIADEVRAGQHDPSRSFEVRDGALLHEGLEGFLYHFRAEVSLPLQADSPVKLLVPGREPAPGFLVGQSDFEVLLEVREGLGETIDEARVTSDPGFIYGLLRERLGEFAKDLAGDLSLPKALLGLAELPSERDEEAARVGRMLLARLDTPSLMPNESQARAIACCAGSRLHFVWGPPGTGKTACLAQVVRTLVEKGERVLVLAHANAAVDVAMVRVARAFDRTATLEGGQVLRIGPPQLPEARAREDILPERVIERTQPELVRQRDRLEARRRELTARLSRRLSGQEKQDVLAELQQLRRQLKTVREQIEQTLKRLIAEARVLGATLSRFVIDEDVWRWPVQAVVLDEASMAPFPAALAAAFRCRERFLVFGDFRQLPPIALSTTKAAQTWFGRDPFEIGGVRQRVDADEPEPRLTLLETQYRMAPAIAELVSGLAYGGRLRTPASVAEAVRALADQEPGPGNAVVVLDSSELGPACFREDRPGSYSRVNPLHAALAVATAAELAHAGLGVALVSPYRAQARILAAASRLVPRTAGVTAATVHRFQGSERDAVVFDLTDAPYAKGASQLTGNDPETATRLLNVALSRARGKLILVADLAFVRAEHRYRSPARALLAQLEEASLVVRPEAGTLGRDFPHGPVEWLDAGEAWQARLARDLEATTGALHLNLPPGVTCTPSLVYALAARARSGQAVVVFGSAEVAAELEDSEVDVRLLTRPAGTFAVIGRTVAYLGGLYPESPVARLEGAAFVEVVRPLLIGPVLAAPPPRAEAEAALAEIGGRCPKCGEHRQPRATEAGLWALRCESGDHPATSIDREVLGRIAQALGLRCPECGAPVVARESANGPFLGCSNYAGSCRGRPPQLKDLFGAH